MKTVKEIEKEARKTITKVFLITLSVMIVTVILITTCSIKLIHHVEETGLKTIIEEIWEGKEGK